MNYVIAIAGPVGSGKSSLVGALVNQLKDATTLYFDHYEDITLRPPHELVQWINNGADFNQFAFHGLALALEKLKQGETVTDPVTNELVESRKFIVFEMPLGRAHAETAHHIDLMIWIDLPLDVALARKLREHSEMFLERYNYEKLQECMSWINGYLDNYLLFVRDILLIQHEKVRPGADLLLDGTIKFNALCDQACQFICTELP